MPRHRGPLFPARPTDLDTPAWITGVLLMGLKKRQQIDVLRAAIKAALIWFEDGTPTQERSTEENAVIADLENALRLTDR